jgi:predicted transposase/invertase (TIGR01784 family)
MVKFRKLESKNMDNALYRWLTYFDIKTPEHKLMEVIKMDIAIQKAQTRLEQVTHDNEFMHNYTLRQMAMSDWTTGVNTAIEKTQIEIARKALAEGSSIDFVKKITGLSDETVMALQSEK